MGRQVHRRPRPRRPVRPRERRRRPLTHTVTDSHQGGWSAARVRWAGFDGLVFEGKADRPVYVFIENGEIDIRDASDTWGLGIHETVAFYQERYGEKNLSVNAIGQAGENLSRFAVWVNEDDRGNEKSDVPDKVAWQGARKAALDTIRDEKNITSPKKGGLSVYGTNVLMNVTNSIGALGVRNSQLTSFGERAETLSGEYVEENLLSGNPTCHACPVACKKEVTVEDGPWKGLKMESVEYEPAWALGANCDVDDIRSVAKLIDQCNDYGLDPIELGNVYSVFMECSEGGLTNGESLSWGDDARMVELTEMLALREGVGDKLADGAVRAAANLGKPEAAMAVKGQAVPAYDPRGLKGMGLGYATSNRGACHLRASVAAAELGELVMIFQDLAAFSDSLDLCKFSAFAQGADEYALQWAGATGVECTADDVMKAGERIYNLERHYNNLAGFREGSDTLPKRFTEEASTLSGSKGHVSELDQMLGEYYAVRGWKEGVVPEDKLAALQIP